MKKIIFVVAAFFTLPVVRSTENEISTNQSAKPYENTLYGRLNFYDNVLVMALNKLETYIFRPLTFNEDELNMLRMPHNFGNKYTVVDKKRTLLKFKRKIQEIKCANVAIVQVILNQFKVIKNLAADNEYASVILNLFEEPMNLSMNDDDANVILNEFKENLSHSTKKDGVSVSKTKRIYYELKKKLAKMLSILYVAKAAAEKWLWKLYFKVCDVVDGINPNKFSLPDDIYLVDDEELNSDILKSIDMCSEDIHRGLATIFTDPIDIIMDILFNPLYGSKRVDRWLGHEFSLKDLYLVELQDKHEILLIEVKGFELDRKKMKENLDAERTLMKNHIASRMWVQQPFPENRYLEHIVLLMKLKVYLHSWLHLTAFVNITSNDAVNNEIENSNKNFVYELEKTAEFIFSKDNIIIEELIAFLLNDLLVTDKSKIENMADRIMKKVKFILNVLNMTISNPLVDDFDTHFWNSNITYLHKYLNHITSINDHVDLSFTLFFLRRNNDDE
ncbi:uncharacterized protein LOC126844605 isoform X2 [Adelges cooleyi]|uniref:uncharacterized protein LOC126844605 isoform X1 n=1 Tax=Adelges cooleyi TaxID=133065 RepID=UPI00217F83A6|nr:uncharacterized protein LOC126844605 isoform X1 [Adelges cooleyi]XP_050438865.1 uncharacterized protein LOC126844605 isoform X2 [Adelges cooleyi]